MKPNNVAFSTVCLFSTIAILGASVNPAFAQFKPRTQRGAGAAGAANRGAGAERKGHALPWSETVGTPAINAGHEVGFFIWHDDSYVYIATTSESDKGLGFKGVARLQEGTIVNPMGLKDEKGDKFKLVKPSELRFHFKTHEGVDGVKFQINGGKHIAFHLELNGKRTDHVFVGGNMKEVDSGKKGILVFDLSK